MPETPEYASNEADREGATNADPVLTDNANDGGPRMAASSSISPVGDSTILDFFGSYDELRRLLRYDAETGNLYYSQRSVEDFLGSKCPEKSANHFNKTFAGRRAFRSLNDSGYFSGSLNNKTFLAHRLAWAIMFSEEPEMLDHLNGDRQDNRIANLRAADAKKNSQNFGVRSDNKSGISGIWRKSPKAWGRCWVVVKSEDSRIIGRKSFHCIGEAIRYRNADLRGRGFVHGHGIRPSSNAQSVGGGA